MIVKEKDANFVEIEKPKSISDVDFDMYYMYSNSLDELGTTYKLITTQTELNVAFKVFKIQK